MLPPTLNQELRNYAIGDKLRGLRLKKKMGLVELGRHTGLSAAMLSKVERGKLFPTLPTLLRIALVFSVGLEYFFSEDRNRHVVGIVRRGERKRFPEKPDGRDISFYFESLDYVALERKLNAYHAEFQPLQPGKARPHQHPGAEFLSVLRGKLEENIATVMHVFELRGFDLFRFVGTSLVVKNQPKTVLCHGHYRPWRRPEGEMGGAGVSKEFCVVAEYSGVTCCGNSRLRCSRYSQAGEKN